MRRGTTALAGDRGGAGGGLGVPARRTPRPGHFRARSRTRFNYRGATGGSFLLRPQSTASPVTFERPYQYTAADFLTLPTLEGIPTTLVNAAAPSAGLADLTEGLMRAGIVHWSYWAGNLADTIETSVKLFTERETGDQEELEMLDWWDFLIAQDVTALDGLYNAEYAAEQLRQRKEFKGKQMAAFALAGSSNERFCVGKGLTKFKERLQSMWGMSPKSCEGIMHSIMGTINVATGLCGGWTPAANLESFMESGWPDEEEDDTDENYQYGFHSSQWENMPSFAFSWRRGTRSLGALSRKLEKSAPEYSSLFWLVDHAYQLSLEMERWVRGNAKGTIGDDHINYLQHEVFPSMLIEWCENGDPDANYHWNDMEMESINQCEHHNVQWMHVFDPTDPNATKIAVNTARRFLGIVGKLDQLLYAIDKLAEQESLAPQVRIRV